MYAVASCLFHCRIIVVFDKFFNIVDASSEVFAATFFNSREGSQFHDAAVSSRIVQHVSMHSFYFFSASSGLFLNMQHNGTQIPLSNFIKRNMQVDEIIEVLQTYGYKSLWLSQPRAAPSALDASNMNPKLPDSDSSSVNTSREVMF